MTDVLKSFNPAAIDYEKTKTNSLKSLGEKVPIPSSYDPSILERIPNTAGEILAQMPCPEWTGMCPKTGQPDFGVIVITYTPGDWLVESKSLKLYMGSFRNEGCFHEDIVARIHDDLAILLEPKQIHVRGMFNARGGIPINVVKATRMYDHNKKQRVADLQSQLDFNFRPINPISSILG